MNNKKMIQQTVGIVLGGVAISESNKIDNPMGKVLGTTIGAGMVLSNLPKGSGKKKGGYF